MEDRRVHQNRKKVWEAVKNLVLLEEITHLGKREGAMAVVIARKTDLIPKTWKEQQKRWTTVLVEVGNKKGWDRGSITENELSK